jgi:hypothetical protein
MPHQMTAVQHARLSERKDMGRTAPFSTKFASSIKLLTYDDHRSYYSGQTSTIRTGTTTICQLTSLLPRYFFFAHARSGSSGSFLFSTCTTGVSGNTSTLRFYSAGQRRSVSCGSSSKVYDTCILWTYVTVVRLSAVPVALLSQL